MVHNLPVDTDSACQALCEMSQEGAQALGETKTVSSDRITAVDTEIAPDYEDEFPSAKQRKIAQRKSLDMMVEDQFNRKVDIDHLSTQLPTDSPTESASNSGDEMNVDFAEEGKETKPPRISLRRSSHMRVTDQATPKTANTGENVTGPPTTESGSNSGKKFKGSEASPELPFEHLTRGDLHTSSGKFWAFSGVQFPGSCTTLASLIPTLRLPITAENLACQINESQLCPREAQHKVDVHPRT